MPSRTINSIGGSAARKRSRRDQNDEDPEQEIAEVREASSSLQNEAVRLLCSLCHDANCTIAL